MKSFNQYTPRKPRRFIVDTPEPTAPYREFRRPYVIVTDPAEMTCLDCGTTTVSTYCPFCSDGNGTSERRGNLVLTTSYLRPGEYQIER